MLNILNKIKTLYNKLTNPNYSYTSAKDKLPKIRRCVTVKRWTGSYYILMDCYLTHKSDQYYWHGTCGTLKDIEVRVNREKDYWKDFH